MRIALGTEAPGFETLGLDGAPFRLGELRGHHVLLSSHRHAACPLCNHRTREVARATPALLEHGIHPVAVFHPPTERVRAYLGRETLPFPILPDSDLRLYRLYGIEHSSAGLLRGMLRVGRLARALRAGDLPGVPDRSLTTLPADFLVGPDGRAVDAYYGRDISDRIPLERLRRPGPVPG